MSVLDKPEPQPEMEEVKPGKWVCPACDHAEYARVQPPHECPEVSP